MSYLYNVHLQSVVNACGQTTYACRRGLVIVILQSPSLLGRFLFTFHSKLYFGFIWNTTFSTKSQGESNFFLSVGETVIAHCLGLIMFLIDLLVVLIPSQYLRNSF